MNACWLAILLAASACAIECPHNDQFSLDAQKRFQFLDRQAQIEFRHGDFAKAAQDFQSGACMLPERARSYYGLYAAAVAAIVAGDFPRSREALTEADRLRPDYESLGLLEQAIPHLKLAIRLAPRQENTYLALARIHEALHKSEAALNVLQQGREQIPDSPRVQLALAKALISAGQYSSSAELLNGLIEKFPDQLEAYPKLAEAYRASGEAGRATEALRRLAARKPEFP